MKTPTVLILGGKDKGNDYSVLKDLVKREVVSDLFILVLTIKKLHATSITLVSLSATLIL